MRTQLSFFLMKTNTTRLVILSFVFFLLSFQGKAQFVIRVNTTLGTGIGTLGGSSSIPTPSGQFFLRSGAPATGVNIVVKDITGTTTYKTYTGVSAGLLIRNIDFDPGFTTATSYQIEYTGVTSFDFSAAGDCKKLTSVVQWGTAAWTSFNSAFYNCTNLTSVSTIDAPVLSSVTNMSYMFALCSSLNAGAFNTWNTGSVTTMTQMFLGCTLFNQPLNSWNTSSVTNMANMLQNATAFNQDISSWNVAAVTVFSAMFQSATAFNQDISSWNVAAVTAFNAMFQGASSYNNAGVSLSTWTPTAATDMTSMFQQSAYNMPLAGGWCGTTLNGVTTMQNMFLSNTVFNQDISCWDVSTVQNFTAMFQGASSYTNAGVSLNTWTPTAATDMASMFRESAYNQPLAGAWCGTTLNGVTTMQYMFLNNTVFNQDISCWNVSTVLNFEGMFQGASSYANAGVSLNTWTPTAATDMTSMFRQSAYNMPLAGGWCGTTLNGVTSMQYMFYSNTVFNQDISCWDVSTVLNFTGMFEATSSYTNAGVSLNTWTPTAATDMTSMFRQSAFNQPLAGGWCGTTLNGVTSMQYMFFSNTVFNQDISCWDVSTVQNFSGMFWATSSYTNAGVSLSTWTPAAATNMSFMFAGSKYNMPLNGNWCGTTLNGATDMSLMFYTNTVFNQDISCWDVSTVTNFSLMFTSAVAYNNANVSLGAWNTISATDMGSMFSNATSFNQSLAGLEINNVTNMAGMLDNSGMDEYRYDSTLIAWSTATRKTNVPLGANGRRYCASFPQRASLILSDGWIISNDLQSCAPGGVSTNLSWWLDASLLTKKSGATVSSGPVDTWSNRTIVNNVPNNYIQATVSSQPTLVANSLNFNPVMRFDGVDDMLRFNSVTSAYRATTSVNQYSVFIIGRFNNSGPVIAHEKAAAPVANSTVTAAGITTDSAAVTQSYNGTTTMSGLQLGAYVYTPRNVNSPYSNGDFSAFLNGNANGTAVTSVGLPTSTGDYLVGGNSAGTSFFNGDIAEVAVYSNNTVGSHPSRRRVETYLSLKWGTTLAAGTAYNYESSQGTTVWTGSTTYQNNISGLGRDSITSLHQQISTSQVAGDVVTLSTDNNFINANGTHTAVTRHHSFLVTGHNNTALTVTQTTGLPASFCGDRLGRQWRVQATNFSQNAFVQVADVSALLALAPSATASNIIMVIDTDGDLNFATGTPTTVTAASLMGNVATFNNVVFQTSGNGVSLFTIMLGNPNVVLVPSGSSISTTISCPKGSYTGYQIPTDRTKVIIAFDPNGNSFSPTTINVHNSGSLVSAGTGTFSNTGTGYYQMTDGVKSIRLTKRLHSVVAPGTFIVGGGVKVRVYYQSADTASMLTDAWPGGGSTSYKGWIKHNTHTAQDVVDNLDPGHIPNSDTITPIAWGTEDGIQYAEFLVTGFSTFGFIASTVATPLPLHLLSFEARKVNKTEALLEWRTAVEEEVNYMEVQHSTEGGNWDIIGQVKAKGSNSGYNFTHRQPSPGINLYRLRIVDKGGAYEYSPTRGLNYEGIGSTLNVYPNPASDQLNIELQGVSLNNQYQLVDALGRVVLQGNLNANSNNKVEVRTVTPGVYTLKIITDSSVSTQQILIKK